MNKVTTQLKPTPLLYHEHNQDLTQAYLQHSTHENSHYSTYHITTFNLK